MTLLSDESKLAEFCLPLHLSWDMTPAPYTPE
jgi:hypothetical protein